MGNDIVEKLCVVERQPGILSGVYLQSDVSLVFVDIDASKGFVDLWVHFFVVIEAIHRNGYRQKS